MEKSNSTMERQVQELVLDYFKDMDDKTISEVVDSFVYATPITDRKSKTSKVLEKFLTDNGLVQAFTNYMIDYKNPSRYFSRASMSEVDMIEKVRNAMLNLSFNRYRALVSKRETNFNFLKKNLLEIFERLNNNDNYYFGEKEDEKFVAKVEAMKS
jgi:uncharacterized membrane-anchored protein YjiN (DUF445 family)